ncbi:glutaredoxin-related protein 5, mitochondrial [Agrilus planipennis]|uniref:Glutaredoxin-related protein 5, mitochondrial n=1 Tax=Agrilus planipennis TaxID=224129 RepID=A0A1W4X6R1_AGRPL|nr:glutaredoxin-related protein 5, mitochondrial [Agrilus planipennis]
MDKFGRSLLKNYVQIARFYSTKSKEEIDKLVKGKNVVVFMKGVPEEPRCGFSNAVVQILRMHGVKYEAHDVLKDESLRQGIKEYSNWPTIPQVYMNGEFVGGCDVMLQMHQSGDLIEEFEKVGIKSALLTKHEKEQKQKEEAEKGKTG